MRTALLTLCVAGAVAAALAADPTPTPALPPPADAGPGLLFHASFDTGNRADFAIGARLPVMARYARFDRTAAGGKRVPGVFGAGFSSPGGRYKTTGSFDALANILPERGTIAFHVRQQGMPYGFEPLRLQTAYHSYYWGMYIRLSNKGGRLSAWFPDEVYRPIVLSVGDKAVLEDGQWRHLAAVWDQAYGARFYVDGKETASNWGHASWTSRGVDANVIALTQNKGVCYDEFYIFDRPLSAQQIADLATTNTAPSLDQLEPVPFDEVRRGNRLRELSWERPDPAMLQLRVGAAGLGANALRQVVPLRARTVKRDCNEVFDGKLGSGWPPLYNYSFNHGNGLHVELGEPWDFATVEGRFGGVVYGEHRLVEEDAEPLARINSTAFMHRWQRQEPREAGWLSFFKAVMEDKGELPDKELVTVSRVCEVSFFRTGAHTLADAWPVRHYLGPANLTCGPAALGVEFLGQFGPGDRAALTLLPSPEANAGGQRLPGLRYHHIVTPLAAADTPLCGLRLVFRLRGVQEGAPLRVEMRDAVLPVRRILAADFALTGASPDATQAQVVDLTLDVADRIIPRGRPCWITFCFRDDVHLVWDGAETCPFIELIIGPQAPAAEEFFRTELAFVKSRFRELSEARPWGAVRDPERELTDISRYARELFLPLTLLRKLNPRHAKVAALWAWTHKHIEDTSPVKPKSVSGCADAPRWALLQRELLAGCRNVLYWWIDNRQTPSGEFGDAWGDDTDLVQNFGKLALLGDPGGRLRDAVRLVADGVYRAGLIERGINARTMDTLHAYEEGVNVQPVMALIDYGAPKYLERLMEAARTVEEHLTAKDVKGRRRFRSWDFGAREVRDKGKHGFDHPGNALFCHPALFLAFYGRHPRAVRFLQEWVDGWLDIYAEHVEPGKWRFPSRTLLDGSVLGWDRKVRGHGYVDMYAALYMLTGEQRYADAARFWTGEHGAGAFMRGGHYLPALELIDRAKFRKQLVSWAEEADLLHPHKDAIGGAARQRYMKFEVAGDEAAAYEALEICLRNLRILFDAYTWGEPIDDRIWLPDHPLIMMTQGEMSDERNQLWPRHYVSYGGFSDFAAWVRDKSDTHLKIRVYSFAKQDESGFVRVWRTPLGEYEVRFGKDADGDEAPDADAETRRLTLHRSAQIPVTLPARTLCTLTIDLAQQSTEDFWRRPDLGLANDDLSWGDDGTLQVTVHNLGASPIAAAMVRLLDANGAVLAEKTVQQLEAPLDLQPRTRTVTFPGLSTRDVTVALDPDNAIPELNEANNTAP